MGLYAVVGHCFDVTLVDISRLVEECMWWSRSRISSRSGWMVWCCGVLFQGMVGLFVVRCEL